MRGTIFNLQRFCVQDGPGIRTTVFFKGCPLRCAWCHNPESQAGEPQILFSAEKCVLCGACAAACPRGLHRFGPEGHAFDREGCVRCGRCAGACYAGALELCGRQAEADEVLEEVLRDAPFYAGGGGLTLSGGEPMAQPEFALALARGAAASGVDVCLETCGFCAWEALEAMLPYVSLFLYDFKLADDGAHRRYTGAGNGRVLENLARLDGAGAGIVLRCPIIPEVNLTAAHFEAVADLANGLRNLRRIELEPYHPLGMEKARRLGRSAPFGNRDFLSREAVEAFAAPLREQVRVPVSVL